MQKHNVTDGITFDSDLVILDLEAKNSEDALRQISAKLIERGLVGSDYVEAVIEREQNFPTGIKTENLGIAIPHTDINYVNQASVTIGVLKNPVIFKQMVSDEEVDVHIIFMLAIKNPNQQLNMLQKLMELIQNSEKLQKILSAFDKKEVVKQVKEAFGSELIS